MREAARALDDVSDHLGEVLRRADELLAEWSRFGAQVRAQVDGEVAAIGEVIDGAVTRAANTGLDRAIASRLRALTAEIDRLEQRTRAASRAVVEQRDTDRRVLWIVVAGIVVANVLLIALLLRKPEAAPVAEPIRMESTAPAAGVPVPGAAPAAASADPAGAANAASAAAISPTAPAGVDANPPAPGATAGSNAAGARAGATAGSNAAGARAGATAGSNAAGARPGSAAAPTAVGKPAPEPDPARPPGDAAEQAKPTASPIALPPKPGSTRPHKKLP